MWAPTITVIVSALSNRIDLGLLDFIRPLKNVGLTASTECCCGKSSTKPHEGSRRCNQSLAPLRVALWMSHLFGVTLMLSKKSSFALSAKMPALPARFPIGSVHSISHSAGSDSPAGHALPRARVLPSGRFSTCSFNLYQVSAFHANGLLKVRFSSICHDRNSIFWMLPNSTSSYR